MSLILYESHTASIPWEFFVEIPPQDDSLPEYVVGLATDDREDTICIVWQLITIEQRIMIAYQLEGKVSFVGGMDSLLECHERIEYIRENSLS